MGTVRKLARQGDLLLVRIKKAPMGVKQAKNNILALGEVTGHSHKADEDVMVLENDKGQKFVEADKSWSITHDEHGPVRLAKGVWEVRRQNEYEPEGVRPVSD